MLRRPLCLLLGLVVTFAMVSCIKSAKGAEHPVTTGFSCDVDVQYGDMTVKGHLKRSTAGTLLIEVSEPATLNGLTMEWDGENIALKLHGLSFNVNPETVPQSALGKSILQTLDAALSAKSDGEMTDEGLLTKGTSSAGNYEILSDADTGNLKKLSIPSANLTAVFSNFETSETVSSST